MTHDFNLGLMLAFMEPPPGLEEEFNDWYDTEHLPQRRGLAGFLCAQRWVCIDGFPRSLASYDLSSLAALEHPDYAAVSGQNSTPWSRRLLGRTARAGRIRMEGQQIWPGPARFLERRQVNRMLVARYPGEHDQSHFIEAAVSRFAELPQLGQLRLFASTTAPFPAMWALAEFKAPIPVGAMMQAAGQLAGSDADLFNAYLPYSGT